MPKIKPIIYHSFEEKEALERKLMAEIPIEERLASWKALTEFFAPKIKKSTAAVKRPRK